MDFVNSKNEPHMEQLCRLRRFYGIFLGNLDYSADNISDNDLTRTDLILSFFLHCYHLRDWLVNSGVVKENIVANFIQNSYEMRICRNLCLGVKHLKVTNPSSPKLYKGVSTPIRRFYDSRGKKKLAVVVDGKEINCFELAGKCLEQWEKFIEENIKN